MKDLIDYDLDTYNALEDFPQDSEDNAVIYIRVETATGEPKHSAIIRGYNSTISVALLGAMYHDKSFVESIKAAYSLYCEDEDKKTPPEFMG